MFSNHAKKDLSAYCNGELSHVDESRIAEHLIGCNSCREEYEEIKLGVKLAQNLPQVSAPDSLWQNLETLLDSEGKAPTSVSPTKRFVWWRPELVTVAATLVLAVAIGAIWFYSRENRPFWEVARLDGAPRIGRSTVHDKGRLALGEWLETDETSRAKISVGSIGQVDVDPNTRIRLLETKATEHRLELARGRMSARIWAPPRLFFVDTPSAVAADLGCAYTLEVNDEGGGILHVTSGWVALQWQGRESIVPAGAACATRRGVGPGTPYFEDSSEIFRHALTKFDFEPNDKDWSKIPTLDLLLNEARPKDSLTLWHLLFRVEMPDRERVYERLAVLSPPPAGVTREGVLQLNQQMLQSWKDKLSNTWSNQSTFRKVWTKIWSQALGGVQGSEGKK
jgi:FecR protein/Putative zinc-finger